MMLKTPLNPMAHSRTLPGLTKGFKLPNASSGPAGGVTKSDSGRPPGGGKRRERSRTIDLSLMLDCSGTE